MSKAVAFKANTKRDSRVELLRLFACFSVLVLHFKPGSFVGGRAVWSRVFVTCLCTDAVGIFLSISGFFFFGRQGYGKRLSGYAKKDFAAYAGVYTVCGDRFSVDAGRAGQLSAGGGGVCQNSFYMESCHPQCTAPVVYVFVRLAGSGVPVAALDQKELADNRRKKADLSNGNPGLFGRE